MISRFVKNIELFILILVVFLVLQPQHAYLQNDTNGSQEEYLRVLARMCLWETSLSEPRCRQTADYILADYYDGVAYCYENYGDEDALFSRCMESVLDPTNSPSPYRQELILYCEYELEKEVNPSCEGWGCIDTASQQIQNTCVSWATSISLNYRDITATCRTEFNPDELGSIEPYGNCVTAGTVSLPAQPPTPTPTNTPAPTRTRTPRPTLTPRLTSTSTLHEINFDPSIHSFAISTDGGVLNTSAFSLPGGAASFARNPVDPNRYATVDTSGLLYLVNDFAGGGRNRMTFAPFSENVPASAETNYANVTEIEWSPDGNYLGFLIDTDSDDNRDNDLANDGVWFLEPQRVTETDPTYQVLRDCPPEPSCAIVQPGAGPYRWRSLSFEWNYQSNGMLITVQLPEENRQAFIIVSVPGQDPNARPPVYRYDFASWSQDGNSIIVSGANPAGTVGVWRVDRSGGQEQLLFDGSASGLWVENAVERPDGQVVMLGSTGGPSGAMTLYDVNGNALSQPIGSAAPERVDWSPGRSAVLLVIREGDLRRYYIVQATGDAREITAEVAGALAVEWVQGAPPLTGRRLRGARSASSTGIISFCVIVVPAFRFAFG